MKKLQKFLVMLLCIGTLMGIMMPAASATTTLTIINLTLDAPVVGQKPTTTASVPSHARSAVQKVEWSGKLDSSGAFQAGVRYTVTVTLGIKRGEDCRFSDKSITAKVNTKAADEVYWYADDKVEVVYTFPKLAESKAPSVVREAHITLTAPEAGKTPASTAKVPTGLDYTVKGVEWEGSLSSGKFKANTEYTAYVTLGIRSGKNAKFSSDVFDAYVNDYLIDEVVWVSDSEVIVPVEFEKTGADSTTSTTSTPTKLNKIRLTVDAPEAMKKPASTASLPSNARSTVQKVEWSGQLDTDGTFMSRTKYTVTVTLGIKAGTNCIFSDKSINATVNGKEADKVLWYAGDKVQVIYTFPAFGTGSTVNTAYITMDGPAAGEKPASTAHLASTDSTYVSDIRWEGQLDSSGRFQGGTEYTAYLTMRVKDEFKDRKFSTKSFDAYVNGVLIDEVTRVSDREIIIPVEFEKTPGRPSVSTTTPDTPAASFTDVKAGDYFAQPVAWAVNNKITSGTGNGRFSPNEECNQAQILSFLWRATGSPEPKGTMAAEGFSGTEYYYKAALWAAERGMIKEGDFDPDAPCTRAMAVTYMWNYAGSPGASPASFTDVAADADCAQAVAWAVAQGVTSGTGNNQFSPDQTCTRGQIVSFLYRAFAK